jgi:hypothetical protein
VAVLPRKRFLCTVCRKAETSGRTTQRDFFACMGLCRHYTARVAELADAPDLGSGGGSHGGSSPPSRTKQYREAGKLEKRSIPKIGACGVAKERHIMHVETTNVTKTSLPEGTGQMKKMLLIIALALLLVPSLAAAQYAGYGYYYPEYSTPQYYRQYAGPRGYPDQFYYRQMPPRVYRNWNHYNRMADQEALERSPLNPESSLQYLFRSF